MFGFALHLGQWLAGEEQGRVEMTARVGSTREVSDPVRRLERAAQQISSRPGRKACGGVTRQGKIGVGLEASQPASFNEFKAEPAESKSRLIVAETGFGNRA